MDDWIKNAADRLIARRARQTQHAHALANDLPAYWERFVGRLEEATKEFNGHEGLDDSVQFNRPHPEEVSISKKTGDGSVSLHFRGESGVRVDMYLPKETIGANSFELGCDTVDSGELCFVHEGRKLSQEEAARGLLEPLFDFLQ